MSNNDSINEIKRIQNELVAQTNSLLSSCKICSSDKCIEINDHYVYNEKNLELTTKHIETLSLCFTKDELNNHFNNHIDPTLTKFSIERRDKLNNLIKKTNSPEERNINKINLIQQIAWDFMLDLYTNKKEVFTNKEDRNAHKELAKTFVELAKMYKEYHQMQLEIIGMGKSEEEQKATMQNFVADMLKRAMGALSDMPEAQEKLTKFLNVMMNPDAYSEDEEEEKK
jgi:hypothetical protein